jgi:hypothetical protein
MMGLVRTIVFLSVPCICVFAAGPNAGVAGRDDPNKSTTRASKDDVEMAVSVPCTQPAGEPCYAVVTVTNHANHAVVYGFANSPYHDCSVIVRGRDTAKEMPLTAYGKSVRAKDGESRKSSESVLSPGQTVLMRFNLCLLYDLTVPGPYDVSISEFFISKEKPDWSKPLTVKGAEFNITQPPPVQMESPSTRPSNDGASRATKP